MICGASRVKLPRRVCPSADSKSTACGALVDCLGLVDFVSRACSIPLSSEGSGTAHLRGASPVLCAGNSAFEITLRGVVVASRAVLRSPVFGFDKFTIFLVLARRACPEMTSSESSSELGNGRGQLGFLTLP